MNHQVRLKNEKNKTNLDENIEELAYEGLDV